MWRRRHSAASSGIVVVSAGRASLSRSSVALPCTKDRLEVVNIVGGVMVFDEAVGDTLAGMEDGRVVAAADRGSDVLERFVREVPGEVDCDLPGPGDAPGAAGGGELVDGDVVVRAD